jgi:vancomycin resistance protein VanJ
MTPMQESAAATGVPGSSVDQVVAGNSKPVRRGCTPMALTLVAWSYLALLIGIAVLLWRAGDLWWPATLLTFGPRWITIAPLPFLALAALFLRRHALIPLAIAGTIAIGPIMGFRVSWQSLSSDAAASDKDVIRVMTCNNGSGGSRRALVKCIRTTKPDLIILQESRALLEIPPELGEGWQSATVGSVLIYSRFPIVHSETLESDRFRNGNRPAGRCDIETPKGVVHVVGVHLETPREGLQRVIHIGWKGARRMETITRVRRTESELSSQMAADCPGPTIVAGDFNMPVDSAIYQQYWSGWQNAFSTAGLGFGDTKNAGYFRMRIDHVLVSRDWRVRNAWVGPNLGGDHRPVIADIER